MTDTDPAHAAIEALDKACQHYERSLVIADYLLGEDYEAQVDNLVTAKQESYRQFAAIVPDYDGGPARADRIRR
jgi:hypothetical protein